MKTFNSLLLASATIGQLALGNVIQARTPAPYQPSGCNYLLNPGVSPCNKKGTLQSPDNLGKPVTVPTANGCADYCFSNSVCKSFAYTTSTKTCQLYAATLSQQKFTVGKTGPNFSNRNCFTQQCSCNNVGLGYGVFNDVTSDLTNTATYRASWDPVLVTGNGASFVGGSGVDTIGFSDSSFPQASNITLYGATYSPNNGSYNFGVSHTFYLLPKYTGEYSVYVYGIDDIVDVWAGSTAYSGWTRSNANLELTTGQTGAFSFNTVAGQYIPIRVVFGQYTGPYDLFLRITDPNNKKVLDNSGSFPQIHTQSCDGTTAPPFPDFN